MIKGLDESLSSFLLFEAYSSWWILGITGLVLSGSSFFLISKMLQLVGAKCPSGLVVTAATSAGRVI